MSYAVAVRALCEFTAKQGDLDLRFTPSPTAAEGMAGHSTVVGRRGAGYVAELPLAGEYPGLLVSGRAAEAIAEYEAALRLRPGDAQIRANLELARRQPSAP